MAETLTEICNLALVSIAKSPIANINEVTEETNGATPNTNSAAICRVNIYESIKRIQSRLRWSDLWTQVDLELKYDIDEINPETGLPWGSWIYNYPNNVLAFERLVSGGVFRVRDKELWSEDPAAVLEYVRYSIEPSEWNTYLTDAIWTDLAMRIAPHLTNSTKGYTERATAVARQTFLDSSAAEAINRSTDIERDKFYELNQTRLNGGGWRNGSGGKWRLRRTGRIPWRH